MFVELDGEKTGEDDDNAYGATDTGDLDDVSGLYEQVRAILVEARSGVGRLK